VIAFWMTLPFALRLALIAILGLIGGALANHIIYAFAYYDPKKISPWGVAAESAPPRTWWDRVPVIGWLGLRRESAIHGQGFWIRPLLIEVSTALCLVLLYRFETQAGGLLPFSLTFPRFLVGYEPLATQMFFSHLVLFVLMVAATFIDFDEWIIPDVITIPGTLIALVIAAVTVDVFMPTAVPFGLPTNIVPTTFDSPWFTRPNQWLDTASGLWVGLAIWSVWCFALMDRRWADVIRRRRGFGRAVKHFFNILFHTGFWKVIVGMWLLGAIGIWWTWTLAGNHWHGLLSALVGLAVGGGVIWAIRIVAAVALNKEAMGFGDVTLMAMIGAFLGWQAAIVAFFLSPFAAIMIVLIRYVLTRDTYTPYGPYLCAGAMMTILFWDGVYNERLIPSLLMIGGFLLWLGIVMLALMAVMLFVWRMIKTVLAR
jgi:leader peptidase (prepilin peptidase) / N-methyltransferase